MAEEKKKLPEDAEKPEEETPKPDAPADEPKAEEKPDEPENKPEEPKEEPKPEPKADKPAEKPAEEEPEPKTEEPAAPAKDSKDEEILSLRTQIAAMKLGISGDCLDDAVAVAESYVKSGKADDINAALSQVIKKYPNMKSESGDEKKGGFKVGADSSKNHDSKPDDRLDKAFGIRKKK